MRRTALVIGLLLLAVAATASPVVAQPTAGNPSDVAADFNNDGVADLAIGVPGEAVGDFNQDGFATWLPLPRSKTSGPWTMPGP